MHPPAQGGDIYTEQGSRIAIADKIINIGHAPMLPLSVVTTTANNWSSRLTFPLTETVSPAFADFGSVLSLQTEIER